MLFLNSANGEKQAAIETIRLATGDDYFPYIDHSLDSGGWSVELVRAAFKQAGLNTELEVLPWARVYKWASELRYEAIFPYVYTDSRAEIFLYSQPLHQTSVFYFVRDDSEIRQLEHTRNKRLCLPAGFLLSDEGEKQLLEMEYIVQRAADQQGCLSQIAKGWSDFSFIAGEGALDKLEREFGQQGRFRTLANQVDTIPLHLLVPKALPGAQTILSHFNRGLQELEQTGARQAIDRYHQQRLAPTVDH